MSKSVMPVSKAKTAYGLLSEIRKLILEEPKRYDHGYEVLIEDEIVNFGPAYASNMPDCGTIACVAGWAVVLKQGKRKYDDVIAPAKALLGLDDEAFNELYDYRAIPYRGIVGIVAHGRMGADHITRFQKKYAKQLKAKRV